MEKIAKICAEEAAQDYVESKKNNWLSTDAWDFVFEAFVAGAEWQASQMPMPEDTALFQKGVEEGRRLEREDMLKDAFVVDYVAVDDGRIELEGDPLPCLNPIILLPYPQFQPGDRVHIIVLKDESK